MLNILAQNFALKLAEHGEEQAPAEDEQSQKHKSIIARSSTISSKGRPSLSKSLAGAMKRKMFQDKKRSVRIMDENGLVCATGSQSSIEGVRSNNGGPPKRMMTLSEIIKNRGNLKGTQVHANYNDMIDEVYEKERRGVRVNLKKLETLIKTEPESFSLSFKRSLQSHINERKRLQEQEIENVLKKQQQLVIEERSERLQKLTDIQKKYNIHLKTKISDAGQEVICLDIPYDQKVRNECNDYHYFFTYKKDRCPILQDKSKTDRQFETGYSAHLLEDFEAQEIKRKETAEKELKRQYKIERALIAEKVQGRTLDKLGKQKGEKDEVKAFAFTGGENTPLGTYVVRGGGTMPSTPSQPIKPVQTPILGLNFAPQQAAGGANQSEQIYNSKIVQYRPQFLQQEQYHAMNKTSLGFVINGSRPENLGRASALNNHSKAGQKIEATRNYMPARPGSTAIEGGPLIINSSGGAISISSSPNDIKKRFFSSSPQRVDTSLAQKRVQISNELHQDAIRKSYPERINEIEEGKELKKEELRKKTVYTPALLFSDGTFLKPRKDGAQQVRNMQLTSVAATPEGSTKASTNIANRLSTGSAMNNRGSIHSIGGIRSPMTAESQFNASSRFAKTSLAIRQEDTQSHPGTVRDLNSKQTEAFARRRTIVKGLQESTISVGMPSRRQNEDTASEINNNKHGQVRINTTPNGFKKTLLGPGQLDSFTPSQFWNYTSTALGGKSKQRKLSAADGPARKLHKSFDKREQRPQGQSESPNKGPSRFNRLFRGQTPKISDQDIKSLISKYPPTPNIAMLMSRLQAIDDLAEQSEPESLNNGSNTQHPNKTLAGLLQGGLALKLEKVKKDSKSNLISKIRAKMESQSKQKRKVIHQVGEQKPSGESMACQTKQLEEEYALRMVEKQAFRRKLAKLMKLTILENELGQTDRKEIELKQLIMQLIAQEQETTYDRMKGLDYARLNNFDTLYEYKVQDYDEQQHLAQDIKNEYISGKFDPHVSMQYERTAREMLRRGMLLM